MNSIKNSLSSDKDLAAKKESENLSKEFFDRVIQPKITDEILKTIAIDSMQIFTDELRNKIENIKIDNNLSEASWGKYIDAITSTMTPDIADNATRSYVHDITLATGAYAVATISTSMTAPSIQKALALSLQKALSGTSVVVTEEVVAGLFGKFIGGLLGVAFLSFDYEHYNDEIGPKRKEIRSELYNNISAIQDLLLSDKKEGVMNGVALVENSVVGALQKRNENNGQCGL